MKKWQKIALGVAVAIPAAYFWEVTLVAVWLAVQLFVMYLYLRCAYQEAKWTRVNLWDTKAITQHFPKKLDCRLRVCAIKIKRLIVLKAAAMKR